MRNLYKEIQFYFPNYEINDLNKGILESIVKTLSNSRSLPISKAADLSFKLIEGYLLSDLFWLVVFVNTCMNSKEYKVRRLLVKIFVIDFDPKQFNDRCEEIMQQNPKHSIVDVFNDALD